jgi:ribosomal protein S12 methylthiotransferase accessory factor
MPASASLTGRENPERLAGILDLLVDDRVGVIRSLVEVHAEAGAPNFFQFHATAANTGAFSRFENFSEAAGSSGVREIAAAKAIGEAVERYCAAVYDIDELPLTSYDTADFACTTPAEFALYSAAQYEQPGFPWVPFEGNTPVRWTRGIDLARDEECHVPAARVFMPYQYYVGTGDAPIDQPISTGLACHLDSASALRAAIAEVVERDAFLIVWQAMMAPPRIRTETLSPENYDLVQRFEVAGSTVAMFDITLDTGIPTILSTLLGDEPGAPALVVAAAASPDPEEAARKSLEELPLTRLYSQYLVSFAPPPASDPPDYESVNSQRTHLHFWTDRAAMPGADFLFSSPARVDFEEIPNLATGSTAADVRAMVERIDAAGERVIAVDLTTADVAELGLNVVRAIVPGFHPLHVGYRLRALGGTRLWRIPQGLGYRGITPESGDNPFPHPYP